MDIRNSGQSLRKFSDKMVEMRMTPDGAKTIKVGEFEKLDKALYLWFRQTYALKIEVSVSLLTQQAQILYEKLYPDAKKKFLGSTSSGDLRRDIKSVVLLHREKRHQLMQRQQSSSRLISPKLQRTIP